MIGNQRAVQAATVSHMVVNNKYLIIVQGSWSPPTDGVPAPSISRCYRRCSEPLALAATVSPLDQRHLGGEAGTERRQHP